MNGVPQTVLYLKFLNQKENQHLSLFCFMHRSTVQSPSHPLLHVLPQMATNFCLKKVAVGVSRKESILHMRKKLFSKKAQPTGSMVPAGYANKVLRKCPSQTVFEHFLCQYSAGTSAAALSRIIESLRLKRNSKIIESNLYHVSCQVPPYD